MAIIEPNLDPSPTELRRFAAIWWPAFFAGVGGVVLYTGGSLGAAADIWIAAACVSAAGLAYPPFMRVVFIGLVRITMPIGIVVSWLLLAVIYFGVITPIGLLSRALRADPLQRDRDEAAATYWNRYDPPEEADRYFEQF